MITSNRNLGYPGSTTLYHSSEGIKTTSLKENYPTYKLLNYPVIVLFSPKAIKKMDNEWKNKGNASTINISANFATGKKIDLFAINCSFFGRVHDDIAVTEAQYYQIPCLDYDEKNDTYHSFIGCARTSMLSKDQTCLATDTLVSFSATYLLGYVFSKETYPFSQRFFNEDQDRAAREIYSFSQSFFNEDQEQLQLEIDVNGENEWALSIYQTKNN